MKRLPAAIAIAATLVLSAMPIPALAGTPGISIDEPTNLALLALGFVGLVVGRRAARKKD